MDQSNSPSDILRRNAAESERLGQQARWRSAIDILLICVSIIVVIAISDSISMALFGASGCLSLGILWYVWRRSQEFIRIARHNRWRDDALEGRGLTLTQWKDGITLPSWVERRDLPKADSE